jgi:lipopolysaccharide biosynthesis regulator YciM
MHVREALANLLVIYEKERDWAACVDTADRLSALSDDKLTLQKAHYHCEMALEARAEGRSADADASLAQALAIEQGCVRASHLRARMAAEQGELTSAARILRRAAEQDAEYLPELLPDMADAFRGLGGLEELRRVLDDLATTHPGAGAELLLFDLIRELDGDAQASRYAAGRLVLTPSLPLLLCSIDLTRRCRRTPEPASCRASDHTSSACSRRRRSTSAGNAGSRRRPGTGNARVAVRGARSNAAVSACPNRDRAAVPVSR